MGIYKQSSEKYRVEINKQNGDRYRVEINKPKWG